MVSTAKKLGPCGGSGGQLKEMNVDGVTRIVKIAVRHGVAIDGFSVRVLRNGVEETISWGGQGGNLTEVELQPNEYITAVKGYYGTFNGMFLVRSLKFETNMRPLGPYGKEDGVAFELPAITGQIIGFHARSGVLVDAFGVYVKANTTSGGSAGGGSTGGSNGTGGSTGTGGTWTQSDTNFWDRPVSN